jgi:hypothetical protein
MKGVLKFLARAVPMAVLSVGLFGATLTAKAGFSLPLLAGQTILVGTVTLDEDDNNYYITYDTTASGWTISETHLAAAAFSSGIPQTKTGNPRPGKFQYSGIHRKGTRIVTYTVPKAGLGINPKFAAHAVVNGPLGLGGTETAWGGVINFRGSNWGLYFEYGGGDGPV